MANTVNLVTAFRPLTDEKFTTESKKALLTNTDYDWNGAHSIKVYKVSTSGMNDYDRGGTNSTTNWSRFGPVSGLDATTEEMTLRKDRSFTFAVDKLDVDETAQQLQAASALERQLREVCIPEIDSYVCSIMCAGAGHKPAAVKLTASNICGEIFKANTALDNSEVPETGRIITVTPDVYLLMKQSKDIFLETDIAEDMRLRGVIAQLDGAKIIKIPANRLPAGFGFMVCHPVATVAPTKLEDYRIHQDPPGISGDLVEGRICYDAFVLDNKKSGIYYQAQPSTGEEAKE